MENIKNTQDVVEKTKKYFAETIKYIYFNKLTFKQWNVYYNILKAALETNTPIENLLNFAEALNYADVMFVFNEDADSINYNKMKHELESIIKRLKEPEISPELKRFILKPVVVKPQR